MCNIWMAEMLWNSLKIAEELGNEEVGKAEVEVKQKEAMLSPNNW